MTTAILYSQFDTKNMYYAPPRKSPSGGSTVFINSSESDYSCPRFQLPACFVPFKIGEPMQGGPGRRSLSLSIKDPALISKLSEIDENNIRKASEESTKWFKKELSPDVVRQFYRPIVNMPSKPEYSPFIKVKLNEYDSTHKKADDNTKVFVMDPNNQYSESSTGDLSQFSEVICMVELSSLYFVGNTFGTTLTATDILITKSGSVQGQKRNRTFDFVLPDAAVSSQ